MISFMLKIALTLVALLGLLLSSKWSSMGPYVLMVYMGLGFGMGWSARRWGNLILKKEKDC